MLFDVRLVAFDDTAVADPTDALVRVFGLDRHAASELLRRLPHVVKRGVTEEGARKLVTALERIGARTEIVLSTKKAPEPSAVQHPLAAANATRTQVAHATAPVAAHGANADVANPGRRTQALPAPAAAARAMIDARAAREQAAAERAKHARASLQQGRAGSSSHGGTASAQAHDHEPDDDSLEADIGMQPRSVAPLLDRSTVAMDRRTPAAERAAQPAERSSLASVPRGAQLAKPALQPTPAASAPAARMSLPQPVAAFGPQAEQGAATSAPPASQSFRVSLAQPITPSLAASPQPVAPFAISLPYVAPANVQRPATSVGSASAINVPVARVRPALPTFSIHGPPVEASACTLPGTKSALFVAWLIALMLATTLTVLSFGILTVVSLVTLSVAWLSRRRALAAMRASALPVGQSQLPELYACVKQFALRLGLASVPRFYVVRGAVEGVRSTTDGGELVLMIDEVSLLRFIESDQPQALSFLVAQELCRHVLGHTKATRRMLARVSPRLACLDLVSADSAATALVVDHTIVKAALLTLLGASRLHAYLDQDELDRVATSTTREPAFWPTRFGADDGFVLARLYHLQRGYV